MRPRKDDCAGLGLVIKTTLGPLARTVDDCAAFMTAVCVPEMWDADLNVPRVPFDTKEYEKMTALKIGYFKTDDFFQPCAALLRGLTETVAGLEKAGHMMVPFTPPTDGWETNRLLVGLNAAEGNLRNYVEALEGEEICDHYKFLLTIANLPNAVRFVLKKVLDKRRSFLLGCVKNGGLSVYDFLHLIQDLLDYRSKWSDAIITSGVDAVLFPAMPIPALPHGMSQKLTSSATYMFIANLLLWPCGAIPVTCVGENEQSYELDDLPVDQRDLMASLVQTVMKDSAGLPLSVNVMTPLNQDEKCLRVMREVEKVAKFTDEPKAYK